MSEKKERKDGRILANRVIQTYDGDGGNNNKKLQIKRISKFLQKKNIFNVHVL